MSEMNIGMCIAILEDNKARALRRLQTDERTTHQAFEAARAKPVEWTPIMVFRTKLDQMADEIDALARTANGFVLFSFNREREEGATNGTRHELFKKLELFGPDKYFSEHESDRWNDNCLAMFRAWVFCRYGGLVLVKVEGTLDDDRDRPTWYRVEMVRT